MTPREDDKSIERYPFSYLPPKVAANFREVLSCHRYGLRQAFAAMCRLTVQSVFHDQGEGTKLKVFDQVEEIASLAGIDERVHRSIRDILFDTDNASLEYPDDAERETIAILLETMKEILHQTYIRRVLLRKKLRMRRFFAAQSDHEADEILNDPKVSPINRQTGTD